MLSLACRNTNKLIRAKSKADNVRLGRLFTKKETALLMANLFVLRQDKTTYTILDPGAGTGILSAAVIERICREVPGCRQIFITCYETDPLFLPLLQDNLERIRKKARHDYDVKLFVTVYDENYIVDSKNHYTVNFFHTVEDTFDLIICNPPSGLCDKASDEAEVAGGVTQVKINEAFLFARMASRHLEPGGQFVTLLPTTVATASQLTAFRREMNEKLSIIKLHLFIGKQKNEKRAIPLKKNIIVAYANSEKPENITITTSTDNGTPDNIVSLPPLSYDFIVNPKDGTLTLPKSVEDTRIVRHIADLPETLSSLGLRMCTGLILDSRCEGLLFSEPTDGAVPLIRPASLGADGSVTHPVPGVRHQFIAPVSRSLVQKNKNMLLIKRVPAGSDERLINAAVYMAATQPGYRYISTHNKINFIDTKAENEEMTPRLVFGLFCLLHSTIYDRYVSIVNKSRQINAKEFRNLPLPPRNLIENMGMRLMDARSTSVKTCDSIVNLSLHIIEK